MISHFFARNRCTFQITICDLTFLIFHIDFCSFLDILLCHAISVFYNVYFSFVFVYYLGCVPLVCHREGGRPFLWPAVVSARGLPPLAESFEREPVRPCWSCC